MVRFPELILSISILINQLNTISGGIRRYEIAQRRYKIGAYRLTKTISIRLKQRKGNIQAVRRYGIAIHSTPYIFLS
jgi:hypothetical protein